MMTLRPLAILAVCIAIAGCAEKPTPPVTAKLDTSRFEKPGCYTVDLFDPVEVAQPAATLPVDHAAYIGHWGGGVWNGNWCHEMIVTGVSPTGEVDLIDMHAPSETYSAPATAFRRKARIFEDGSLRFVHGTVVRHYQLRDGKLHARREGDGFGVMRAVLSRKGDAPVPRARPIRLAQN